MNLTHRRCFPGGMRVGCLGPSLPVGVIERGGVRKPAHLRRIIMNPQCSIIKQLSYEALQKCFFTGILDFRTL